MATESRVIKKPQVLFFFATWSGPCQSFRTVLERAVGAYNDEYQASQYYDVDDTEEWILALHRVLGVPTTVLVGKHGKELARLVGYNSYDATLNFLRKGVL